MATRAVLSGGRTYELAGRWVATTTAVSRSLTHEPPDDPAAPGRVVYAADPSEAASRARTAAG
jgi:hypothetical protein